MVLFYLKVQQYAIIYKFNQTRCMCYEERHMNNNNGHLGVLALIAFIALILAAYVLPPVSKPKTSRISRITAVNHISSVSMSMNLLTSPLVFPGPRLLPGTRTGVLPSK